MKGFWAVEHVAGIACIIWSFECRQIQTNLQLRWAEITEIDCWNDDFLESNKEYSHTFF